MTPEQLEAHRVRFEQRFYADFGFEPLRLSYGYVEQIALSAWQAYQWALADADRAQRAAPVSEAVWCEAFDESMLEDMARAEFESAMAGGVSLDSFMRLARSVHKRTSLVATPQPVEVQPVAWVERWHGSPSEEGWSVWEGREMIAHLGTDNSDGDAATRLVRAHNSAIAKFAQPVEVQPVASSVNFLPHDNYLRFVQRVLEGDASKSDKEDAARMVRDVRRSIYTAAQPVAREPMSWDEVVKGADEHFMIGNPEQVCTFDKGVKYAERHHGIKPTSAEGGL